MSVPAAYIAVILIWSTTPLAVKWSGQDAGYLFGVVARMGIGALVCVVILAFLRQSLYWHKRAILAYCAASIGVYGSMLLVYWGSQYIPSGLLSVLFGLTPLLTGIFSAVMLNERSLSINKIAGASLGIAGLVAIFHSNIATSEHANIGIAAVLIATTLHSLSTVLIKKINSDLPSIVLNTGSLLLASLLFLLTWIFSEQAMPSTLSLRGGVSILYLGIFGSVIGFTLYYYALKHMDANRIGLIPLITPLLALLLGHFLNHESIGLMIWLGAALIITGLLLHQGRLMLPIYLRKTESS